MRFTKLGELDKRTVVHREIVLAKIQAVLHTLAAVLLLLAFLVAVGAIRL